MNPTCEQEAAESLPRFSGGCWMGTLLSLLPAARRARHHLVEHRRRLLHAGSRTLSLRPRSTRVTAARTSVVVIIRLALRSGSPLVATERLQASRAHRPGQPTTSRRPDCADRLDCRVSAKADQRDLDLSSGYLADLYQPDDRRSADITRADHRSLVRSTTTATGGSRPA